MDDIHARIKRLRQAKQLSMEALADLVGVTWQTVQQWEKPDGTAPKRTRLQAVADALGTTIEHLTTGHQLLHVAEPAGAPYAVLPVRSNPMLEELIEVARGLNEKGLAALIERAHALRERYAAEAKRPLSQ